MSDAPTVMEILGSREFQRAAVALVSVGAAAGMLGCVLMARRLALLADVLAHAMLPGVGIAWLIAGVSGPALSLGALGAGLAAALGSGLLSRLTRLAEDAASAALFATLFAVGLVLAEVTGGSGELMHLLAGDPLGIKREDLVIAAAVGGATVLAIAALYRGIVLECFDPEFHRAAGGRGTWIHLGLLALVVLTLVAALRAVGAVMAVGLFMLPAVTAALWCRRWSTMLVASAVIASLGSCVGLFIACRVQVSPGPCVVTTLGALFALSLLATPLRRLLERRHARHHHRENSDEWCEVAPKA